MSRRDLPSILTSSEPDVAVAASDAAADDDCDCKTRGDVDKDRVSAATVGDEGEKAWLTDDDNETTANAASAIRGSGLGMV